MKHRHVYSTPDVPSAARSAGVGDDCIALVARSDIELDSIPTSIAKPTPTSSRRPSAAPDGVARRGCWPDWWRWSPRRWA